MNYLHQNLNNLKVNCQLYWDVTHDKFRVWKFRAKDNHWHSKPYYPYKHRAFKLLRSVVCMICFKSLSMCLEILLQPRLKEKRMEPIEGVF